jgi:hypothetical protein
MNLLKHRQLAEAMADKGRADDAKHALLPTVACALEVALNFTTFSDCSSE